MDKQKLRKERKATDLTQKGSNCSSFNRWIEHLSSRFRIISA